MHGECSDRSQELGTGDATQGATDPPTFTLFANKELPATYLRYIERQLREAFDMGATPIKIRVRRRGD